MKYLTKYIKFFGVKSLILILSLSYFNDVKALPPEQILPERIEDLEYLGGAWIPLNNSEAMYGGNLDEGSYWYHLAQGKNTVFLILQQLQARTSDGKPIMKNLDVVVVPELGKQSTYGIMRGVQENCIYPNGQKLQDSRILIIVKYHQDTATPIRSFLANLQTEKWETPPASTIKGLVCQLEIP